MPGIFFMKFRKSKNWMYLRPSRLNFQINTFVIGGLMQLNVHWTFKKSIKLWNRFPENNTYVENDKFS